MDNRHTTPYEMVEMMWEVKLPIFVARQWVRHRTARLNEISARYTVMPEEFYLPESGTIRRQSGRSKQGRAEEEIPAERQAAILQILKRDQAAAYASYQDMLNDDVARELARINLPLSLYTQWYWQIDLHNLFHFLKLRMDPHAQLEIREYARVMAEMARAVAPLAYEAFEEHVLYGTRISRSTRDRLVDLLRTAGRRSPDAAEILNELEP